MLIKVHKAIAEGDLKKAIDLFKLLAGTNSELIEDYTKISGRWNRLTKDRHSGIIKDDEFTIEENKIRTALIHHVNIAELTIKEEEKKHITKKITNSTIGKYTFLAFIAFTLLLFYLLSVNGLKSYSLSAETIKEEHFLRDNLMTKKRDLKIKPNIISFDNLVFDSISCPSFIELRNEYPLVAPLNFNLINILENEWEINMETPSFKRFDLLFENKIKEINALLSIEERHDMICSDAFWDLKTTAKTHVNGVEFLLLPQVPQASIVFFELEAKGLETIVLSENSGEDPLSEILRGVSDDRVEIFPHENSAKVCMIPGERIDFETEYGIYSILLDRISNPGHWREPFHQSEDIVSVILEYHKK